MEELNYGSASWEEEEGEEEQLTSLRLSWVSSVTFPVYQTQSHPKESHSFLHLIFFLLSSRCVCVCVCVEADYSLSSSIICSSIIQQTFRSASMQTAEHIKHEFKHRPADSRRSWTHRDITAITKSKLDQILGSDFSKWRWVELLARRHSPLVRLKVVFIIGTKVRFDGLVIYLHSGGTLQRADTQTLEWNHRTTGGAFQSSSIKYVFWQNSVFIQAAPAFVSPALTRPSWWILWFCCRAQSVHLSLMSLTNSHF